MKVVVASVVYKAALEYLNDFLGSVSEQNTDQDFTVLLLNDDIPEKQLEHIIQESPLKKGQDIVSLSSHRGSSICQLRVQLLREAKLRGFEFMLLADCDDMLSASRLACYLKAIGPQYSFYYNELLDFAGHAVMPKLPAETRSWKQIGEENYLGMGNTGIDLRAFSLEFIDSLSVEKIFVFDWYLFSRILLAGMRGKKVEGCYTYYRIHDGNIAGRVCWSEEQVHKEIAIKMQHYSLLKSYDPYYRMLLDRYEKLQYAQIPQRKDEDSAFWWGLINTQTGGQLWLQSYQQEGGQKGFPGKI